MLGRVVLGRYEILQSLGQGSMGQVWLAQDRTQPRHVVVKQIREHSGDRTRYRELFQREIQFMARFRHPHAVEFYEGSLDDPSGPCIIMEYVRGVGLDEVLRKRRFVMPERVGHLLVQLCQALHAAHASGIVHRDLKPANLMVMGPDTPKEFLKVLDLGLAQLTAKPYLPLEKLQGSGDEFAAGTPAYVCPEQLRGDPTDHRGDIYSLGVVLFELLTGHLPFDEDDPQEQLMAHVSRQPPTFKDVGMGILPPKVEAVVQQCLSKYPNERPQSAYQLACLFQTALGRPDDLDPQPFQPLSGTMPAVADGPSTRYPNTDRIVEKLEAWMPEPIAVVKLRGFVEDAGGRVVASEPGLVQVILGEPKEEPKRKSTIFRWLTGQPEPGPVGPPPVPPVAIDLYMTKKDARGKSMLDVRVVFRAVDGPLPGDRRWHQRCHELLGQLRGYLMA
jgi:serine/threonine protein kinase